MVSQQPAGSRIVTREVERAAKLKEAKAAQVTGSSGQRLSGSGNTGHDNYANYVDTIYTRYGDGR